MKDVGLKKDTVEFGNTTRDLLLKHALDHEIARATEAESALRLGAAGNIRVQFLEDYIVPKTGEELHNVLVVALYSLSDPEVMISSAWAELPGGGTPVIANPEGEATADLIKIKIGDVIYRIPTGQLYTAGYGIDITNNAIAVDTANIATVASVETLAEEVANKSTVSVSASGTATNEVQYITIDDVEYKLAGGGGGTGPIGPTGPQGPAGEVGPTGPKGEDGLVGPTGPQGLQGPTGEAGPIGPTGERGADGAVGPTGAKGDKGDQGEQGPAGPTGEQGPIGPTGLMGPTGPKGEDGKSIQVKASAEECTKIGDGYIDQTNGHLMILTSLEPRQFTDAGEIKGPKGDKGDKGDQGDTGPTGSKGEDGLTTKITVNGQTYEQVEGTITLPDYNENNVKFAQDLSTMYTIGKYNGTLAQAVTIPAAGKTIKEVWNDIFQKEDEPKVTNPSVSISSDNIGEKETGENIAVNYSTNFDKGSYTYGPDTGITASDYKIKFNTETLTNTLGTFTSVQVTDATSLVISGTFDHTEGAIPKTNLGNERPNLRIAAANDKATGTKGTLSGYRKMFYGTLTTTETLTSAIIRGLSSEKVVEKPGNSLEVNIPVGAKRVVIAVPYDSTTISGKSWTYEVNSVKDVNDSLTEIISSFVVNNITVEGANNFAPINYKVYICDYANPVTVANTYKVNIKK